MPEKIIYFMDNYSNLGGAANTLLRQAILMKKAGKKVLVVVSTQGNVCKDYLLVCSKEEIPVYEVCYSVTNQPEGVDVCSVLENYSGVRRFLKEHSPDIVHSVQLNSVVELVCRELKIPHIMNVYQALPIFFRWKYADIFPHYHICDSVCYADFWKQYLGTRSYCVRTVAESEDESRWHINKDNIIFVCVGLLCERKNQLEVIKAFEIAVKRYGVRGKLRFWGRMESSYTDLCEQYIVNNELQEYVAIKGFSQNMEGVYRESDVLISGSICESYPNVISEALSHGLVVISTPVAGVPEVIKDRENGYLCKGYKAEDLAECIREVHNDIKTNSIVNLLEKAYATYEKIHSPEAVTSELLDCYKDVLEHYKVEKRYTINELKEEFAGFMDTFYKYQDYFTSADYVKKNLWKIYYVIQSLRRLSMGCSFYIWGTGKYGRVYGEILDIFAPDVSIAGYIDSYAKGQYMGYKIVRPEEVLHNSHSIILVGVITKRDEILDNLHQYQFGYNDRYFIFDPLGW